MSHDETDTDDAQIGETLKELGVDPDDVYESEEAMQEAKGVRFTGEWAETETGLEDLTPEEVHDLSRRDR